MKKYLEPAKKIATTVLIPVLFVVILLLLYFDLFHIFNRKETFKIKDNIVKTVKVEYSVKGNIFGKLKLTELNNKDVEVSKVAASMGFSFDLSGNFNEDNLKKGKVTINYNDMALDMKFDESRLGIFAYNEETNNVEEIESKVDSIKNTITFDLDKFNRFVVVDTGQWEEIWKRDLAKVRTEDDFFNVSMIVDDSGSMSYNDESDDRLQAVRETVSILSDRDYFSIISYETNVNVLLEFTQDTSKVNTALSKFKHNGVTETSLALEKAMDEIEKLDNKGKNVIILLTDGEDSKLKKNSNSIIERAKSLNIVIYSIGLADKTVNETDFLPLKEIAEKTDGQFFNIRENEVSEIFEHITGATVGYDPNIDTDGDGLPDGLEEHGFRDYLGNLVKTDPTEADTDGDGISDKDEIGELINNSYYEMPSNPVDNESSGYTLGPTRVNVDFTFGDSRFRANRNAFQFINFGVIDNDKTYDSLAPGIAFLTEKIYNDTLSKNGDTYGTYLKEKDFGKIISNKKLYNYLSDSVELQKIKYKKEYNDVGKNAKIDINSENIYERDKELIQELMVQTDEFNSILLSPEIGYRNINKIDTSTIYAIRDVFKKEHHIITIALGTADSTDNSINYKMVLNAYAIEKLDNDDFVLYVYDSNFPYNQYLSNIEGFANNYIYLRKNWQGTYDFEYKPVSDPNYQVTSSTNGLISLYHNGRVLR